MSLSAFEVNFSNSVELKKWKILLKKVETTLSTNFSTLSVLFHLKKSLIVAEMLSTTKVSVFVLIWKVCKLKNVPSNCVGWNTTFKHFVLRQIVRPTTFILILCKLSYRNWYKLYIVTSLKYLCLILDYLTIIFRLIALLIKNVY